MADSIEEGLDHLKLQDSTTNITEESGPLDDNDEFKAHFMNLAHKRKKRPKKEKAEGEESSRIAGENDDHEILNEEATLFSEKQNQEYNFLLTRIFNTLREQNPDLAGDRKRFTIVPPIIHREGNKKTAFVNIHEICKKLNRNMEHLTQFLFSELGTTGSTDASQRLIIKGRFQPKQIESVLRKYIVEYVTCKTCKSPNTTVVRENRLFFQNCESCGSTRTVAAIKTGFQALTSKRAALRNKEA